MAPSLRRFEACLLMQSNLMRLQLIHYAFVTCGVSNQRQFLRIPINLSSHVSLIKASPAIRIETFHTSLK